MNITVLANKDLASCVALNYLLPRLGEHEVTLFLSARVGGRQKERQAEQQEEQQTAQQQAKQHEEQQKEQASIPPPLAELRFFEQTLFTELLFPAIDGASDSGSEHETEQRLFSFAGLARRFGVRAVEELNRINEGEGFVRLAASEPDLILSIRYGVILQEAVIGLPRLGVLNLHSGHLPHYRGVMASFWALLNGEAALGTTLHYISDGSIDTGPIVATTSVPVRPGRSYLCQVLGLYEEGCKQMALAVKTLAAGKPLPSRPQPTGGQYYSFPTEADLARFHAAGWQLLEREAVLALGRRFLLCS